MGLESQIRLWEKAFNAFEVMYYINRLRGVTISEDAYRLYAKNYNSDSEIRRKADFLWQILGTPETGHQVARLARAAGTGVLIGAGAIGTHEAYKRRASLLSRRALLIYAGLTIAALAGLESACSKSGGGPGPGPSPVFVKFAGPVPLEGLLKYTKVNGEMTIPGAKKVIPITNGTVMIDESYELLERAYTNVVIVTDYVKRSTPLELNNSGGLVDLGYTKVPWDVVDDAGVYAVWETTRRDPNNLSRWGDVRGFRKFFHDGSLWRAEGGKLIKIRDDYMPDPSVIQGVTTVANNYLSDFSGGQVPNGLILESQSDLRPYPRDSGWLVYYIRDNTIFPIDQNDNGANNGGNLTNASLAIRAGLPFVINGIAQDTWESLGFMPQSQGRSQGAVNYDGSPSAAAKQWGRIQYFRKIGQTSIGDIPDHQT